MNGTYTLLARTALGIIVAAAGLIALRWPGLDKLSDARFRVLATATLLISRLCLFSLIFLVAGLQPRGDVIGAYFPEAQAVLQHLVPYVNFVSSYAPLHPYIDSLFVMVWNSPLSLILFTISAETLMFLLWITIARRLDAEPHERVMRMAAVLFIFNPVSVQFSTVDGQDNAAIGALLALSLLLLTFSRPLLAGLSMGFSIVAFKFLPLLFVPAFFFGARRRWLWTVGFAIFGVIPYVILAARHIPVFQPLVVESGMRTGSDFPFFFETVSGIYVKSRTWDVLTLVALLSVIGLLWFYRSRVSGFRLVTHAMPALLLVLLITSKKSWPNYLPMVLFPLCLVVAPLRRSAQVAFLFFCVIAVVHGSYWTFTAGMTDSQTIHSALRQGQPYALGFVAILFTLLTGYALMLFACLRDIRQRSFLTEPRSGIRPAYV